MLKVTSSYSVVFLLLFVLCCVLVRLPQHCVPRAVLVGAPQELGGGGGGDPIISNAFLIKHWGQGYNNMFSELRV